MDRLLISPVGGLANRMRAIASGISLAQNLGVSDVEVAWPVNSDLFCRFEELFEDQSQLFRVIDTGPLKDIFLHDIPRKKNLYLANIVQKGRYGSKLTDWDTLPTLADDPALMEKTARSIRGTLMIRSGVEYYPFGGRLYRSIFRPLPEIVAGARDRIQAAPGRRVGMHIRRSDNVASIRHSPVYLFVDAAEKELASDPGTRLYLATDDQAVKDDFISRFGDRIITSARDADRNSPAGIREALTEMLSLSLCSKIYGSYWSSFSEASAMLGEVTLETLAVS